MPDRERGETGQFVETVGLEDVLGLFDRVDGPVLTSSDVAEAFDITTEAARQKLTRLVDRGELAKRKTGRTVVYWRVDEPEEPPERPLHVTANTAGDRNTSDTTPDPSTPSERRTDALSETGPDETPRSLADVEFPVGRDREECEAAILAARDHIREHGGATMRELVAAIMPTHSLGYDVPELPLEENERFRGAWWRKVVRPGLEALEDVEKPPRGGSEWRHAGEPDEPEDADEEIPTTGGTYDPTEEF